MHPHILNIGRRHASNPVRYAVQFFLHAPEVLVDWRRCPHHLKVNCILWKNILEHQICSRAVVLLKRTNNTCQSNWRCRVNNQIELLVPEKLFNFCQENWFNKELDHSLFDFTSVELVRKGDIGHTAAMFTNECGRVHILGSSRCHTDTMSPSDAFLHQIKVYR